MLRKVACYAALHSVMMPLIPMYRYTIRRSSGRDRYRYVWLPISVPMAIPGSAQQHEVSTSWVKKPCCARYIVMVRLPIRKYICVMAVNSSLRSDTSRKYSTAGGPCIPKSPPIAPDILPSETCVGKEGLTRNLPEKHQKYMATLMSVMPRIPLRI